MYIFYPRMILLYHHANRKQYHAVHLMTLSPRANPLISLTPENFLSQLVKEPTGPIEETCPGGLCFCYQRDLSISIESMSASHFRAKSILPTASLCWAFLLSFLISVLFYIPKNFIHLFITPFFDTKTERARIQPLSPISLIPSHSSCRGWR